MERTDAELVRLARQGDRGAFQELVERYQRKIYVLLLGMLHEHDAAWERTQETFIQALRGLDEFKHEASFPTWLYRIAVNVAIDFQRHEWRRPLVGVVDDAVSSRIGERVRAAIDELTPEHRAAILLREVEGLSYEEISRVMECAKGTVMSRLHDARRKLQILLKDCL